MDHLESGLRALEEWEEVEEEEHVSFSTGALQQREEILRNALHELGQGVMSDGALWRVQGKGKRLRLVAS